MLAAVLAGGCVFGLFPALTPLATVVVVLTMIGATIMGVRLWRPPATRPWHLLALSAAVALACGIAAMGVREGSALDELLPFPEYVVAGAALVAFDRARRGRGDRTLPVDAAIVGVSVGLLAFTAFVSPVLDRDFTPIARATRATYPALDAVLLFLVVRLGFGGAWRHGAFRLLAVGFSAALAGDLVWAAYDAGLIGRPHGADDIAYLVAYAALGLASLHPSMAELTSPAAREQSPWGSLRLVAVAGSLAVPVGLAVFAPPEGVLERSVYSAGGLVMVALVSWRLVTAVNRHTASEALLAHAATHDPLTGLANRAEVAAEIDAAVSRATGPRDPGGVAVILLDIDRFQALNEGWGHALGDELLGAVARRLCLAGPTGLVGRISGDNFAVVCTDVADGQHADRLGRQALEAFQKPFAVSVGRVAVPASVGVAFVDHGTRASGEQLLRDADTAMHRSKDAGGNRTTVFSETMRAAVRRRHAIEQSLRRAIELGDVRVHYQPIVDLRTRRPVGFEALLRWFPGIGRTAIPPSDFVPIAEETGLIVPLGARAFGEAATFLAGCRARHPLLDLEMSVNLSPRQLREPGILETVQDVVSATGLPPHALCVEITESAMLESGAVSVDENLARMRSLGVRIAADDFGTGYSSLPYLKRFLVGRLKIDMAFVHGLGVSEHDDAIVAGILAIAHSLGLDVVAEGVESREQALRLRSLGCSLAQGYLFAPALTAEAAMEFLARHALVPQVG